jgi:HSP20 family molecular chaperone IbpA
MKCKCGKDVKEEWNFCPICGEGVPKGPFGVFGKQKRQLSPEEQMELQMERTMKQAEGMFKMMGLPAKINFRVIRQGPEGDEQMQPIHFELGTGREATRQKAPKAKQPEEAPRDVKEMLEPISTVTKTAKGLKVVMQLPGVRSVDDIKIRQFSESIEIRAYADKRGYFKVIPTAPNSKISDKKFMNEMLKLVISS